MVSQKYLFLGVILSLTLEQVTPSNILVISFFSGKSHKLTYMRLVEELGKRGHNISRVSSKTTKGDEERQGNLYIRLARIVGSAYRRIRPEREMSFYGLR